MYSLAHWQRRLPGCTVHHMQSLLVHWQGGYGDTARSVHHMEDPSAHGKAVARLHFMHCAPYLDVLCTISQCTVHHIFMHYGPYAAPVSALAKWVTQIFENFQKLACLLLHI